MGLFWDLMQESRMSKSDDRADKLQERVEYLEEQLDATRRLLTRLIDRLEQHFGEDLDRDGRVGRRDRPAEGDS
jgi:hypothetical protein